MDRLWALAQNHEFKFCLKKKTKVRILIHVVQFQATHSEHVERIGELMRC